jgi:hypothetical protein
MPALIPVLPAMVWQTPANLSQESKVFCPICVANGYSSSVRKPKDWFFSVNNVGAALWYTSIPRTQVGLTFHGSSRAIRPIITYQPVTETTNTPALNVSYGLQSQETGSTGAAVTLEKNFYLPNLEINAFGGAARRTFETFNRTVYGVKIAYKEAWVLGHQFDGRDPNPFVQYRWDDYSVGILLVSGKNATLTFGITF